MVGCEDWEAGRMERRFWVGVDRGSDELLGLLELAANLI